MNRYNQQLQVVKPEPAQTYAITPTQAQQLERMTQPVQPVISVPTQNTQTVFDTSAIFEPLAVKEQFSPTEKARGFMLRSALFVGGALVISLAAAWKMNLTRVDSFFFFAVAMLVTLIVLNRQEQHYSAAGLALRHQADAKDALQVIVASNETVTLAKLENEDRVHEREINLRRELAAGYLKQLGGNRE
jgi:predicted nucleic acid-binding protein